MDIVFALILATLAGIPSLIGVEMANRPPTNNSRLLWGYRLAFLLVFVLTVVVVAFQVTRNAAEQADLKQEATAEQGKRDSQYYAVKAKLDLIQGLLASAAC
jgi:hypothetical protein